MSNSIPAQFTNVNHFGGGIGLTEAEHRRNSWLRTSFVYETPSSLLARAASVLGHTEKEVEEIYREIKDVYLNQLKGNEFVEGIHVTLSLPDQEGKCEFTMGVTTTLLDGKVKYQNRKDFSFSTERPGMERIEVLAKVICHHYFFKPLHIQGTRVNRGGQWNLLIGAGKDELVKIDDETLIDNIRDNLIRGDKVSLNRVPLILHQDSRGRSSKWFGYQNTRNGKQVSGKSAGLDSYLKSLGYNQEDLDKLGQLKVDVAIDKLTIEEAYERLKEII